MEQTAVDVVRFFGGFGAIAPFPDAVQQLRVRVNDVSVDHLRSARANIQALTALRNSAGPASPSIRADLSARIASVIAATHRGALVGTEKDALEHERRSAGRVHNVLPIFGVAARSLDMAGFLQNFVCL